MLFYLILFVNISIFSLCHSKSKDVYIAGFAKILVFLLLFIPAALRYGIGTDYFSYVRNFNLISHGVVTRLEPGFVAINHLSDFLNLGAQGVFAITAFFTYLFLLIAVPKKSFFIIIPVYFCMFYAFSYNVIRNALAISIAYCAYHAFSNRKIILSFILVSIASLFHISALLFFPMFLIMLIVKMDKLAAIITFTFFSFGIYLFGFSIIDWILNIVVSKTTFARYIGSIFIQRTSSSFFFAAIQLFVSVTVLFFMPNDKNKNISNIFIFLLIANLVYIFGSLSDIFNRMYIVYSIVWLFVIHYVNANRFPYRRILLLFIFLWSLGSFIAAVGFLESSNVIPYKTIWSR